MTLLGLIVLFIVVGVIMYLVNTYIPMAQPIKTLLNVAVVIVLVLFLINALGLLGPLDVPLRVR